MGKKISRRRFLRGLGTLAAGTAVAACQPKTVIVEKEVEKPVTQIVEVEKEVTKIVAGTPVVETVIETKVVEKIVKETVVVEKEVQAAPEEKMSEVQELRVKESFFEDIALLSPPFRGESSVHALLWAPLVGYDAQANPVAEKGLATSWEVSDDGKVYTFYLRQDGKYSDGTTITAHDVVWDVGHYAMLMHPKLSGYRGNWGHGSRYFADLVGFFEVKNNSQDIEPDEFGSYPVEGVEAMDDFTVQFTLEGPTTNFLQRLIGGFAVFKPDDVLAGKETEYDLLDYWPSYSHASGQYKITKVVPGESFVMEPNEHYWGPKPIIQRITCLFVSSDWNTILTAFANKELDLVQQRFGGQTARQALSDPYLESCLIEAPSWGINQIWITPNQPLDDMHVRRAFSLAIDREALINILNAGAPLPLWQPLNMHRNPAVPHCQEETAKVTMLPFDPAQAKQELEQSEYWPDVLDMEIHMYAANAEIVPRMEAVQKMLEDNLGMTNIIIHTEQLADWLNPPFPMHLWWNGQTPHAAYLLGTLANMINQSKIVPYSGPPLKDERHPTISVAENPELRELIDKAIAETDMAKQCEYVRQFGQKWNDDVESLDMALAIEYQLVAPWVKELELFPGGFNVPINFEKCWIAQH